MTELLHKKSTIIKPRNNNTQRLIKSTQNLFDQNQHSILWIKRIQSNNNNNNNKNQSICSTSSSSSSSSSDSDSDQSESNQQEPEQTTTTNTIISKNPEKRIRAIQELIESESIYTSDLIIIRDIYLHRASHPINHQPPILSDHDRLIIFSNIPQLIQLAQAITHHLSGHHHHNDQGTDSSVYDQIGRRFIGFLARIEKLFTIYCSNYQRANGRLVQLINANKAKLKPLSSDGQQNRFLNYLEESRIQSQGKTTAWDLGSLLIKPVQRCLKYSLLLDQIISHTPADHPDLDSLIKARDGMVKVAETINEQKRRHECVGEIISRPTRLGARFILGHRTSGGWVSPVELTTLIDKLEVSSRALESLVIDLKSYDKSIRKWLLCAERLVDRFKAVYTLSRHDSPASFGLQDVLELDRYKHFVIRASLNGPIKYLHERIETEIIPKLEELRKLYSKPELMIQEYERRKQAVAETTSGGTPETSPFRRSHSDTSFDLPSSSSSLSSSSTGMARRADEVKELEAFLLDQLPKLIAAAAATLALILAKLFEYLKLCHSDLIILIRKSFSKIS